MSTTHGWRDGKEVRYLKDDDNGKCYGPHEILDLDPERIKRGGFDQITSHADWVGGSPRIPGIYQYGSAQAELSRRYSKEKGHFLYLVRMNCPGNRAGDLKELYRLIRVGEITPIADYNKPQVDTPARQFRDLLREFLLLCRIRLNQLEKTS